MNTAHRVGLCAFVVAGVMVGLPCLAAETGAVAPGDLSLEVSEAEQLEFDVAFLKFGPDASEADIAHREHILAAIKQLTDRKQRERLLGLVQQRHIEDLEFAIDLLRLGAGASVDDVKRREQIERAIGQVADTDTQTALRQRLADREAEEHAFASPDEHDLAP